MSIYEQGQVIKRKKMRITPFSFSVAILLFINLMLQENAFGFHLKAIWIYVMDLGVIFVGIIDYFTKRSTIRVKDIKENARFLIPFVVVTIYSIVLNCLNNKLPFEEILTTGLYWIIPIVAAIIIYLDVNILGVQIIYNIILLNYTVVILKCSSVEGSSYFFHLSTYTDNFGSLLEVHPIGLALPLFLIYFLFEHYQNKKKLGWKFWIGVLYTFMCGKRIALVGMIAVLIVYYVLRKSPKRFEKAQLRIYMGIVFFMTFAYLLFVKYNGIQCIAQLFGVNTMTRLETWGALKDSYTISPLFAGNGVGYSMYYLNNLGGIYINGFLNKIGDVHNDILKTYVDVGFFLFIYFMWYLLIGNLKFFVKKKCVDTALLYFLLMVYTVFLMFVDNIMRYDLYLLTLFLITMSYRKKEEESDR